MNKNVDIMLDKLSPAIDAKCERLKEARKEKIMSRVFLILCAAVVLLPTLFVAAGVSVTFLVALPAFMSLSIIVLLPVLISGKNEFQGGNDEHA